MVDPEILRIASRAADVDIHQRKKAFAAEIASIKEQGSRAGMGRSSRTVISIREAIERELELRVMTILQALARVLSTQELPLDPGLADELKAFVRGELEVHTDDLSAQRERVVKWNLALMPSIPDLASPALARIDTEIDISLLSARRRGEVAGSTTVNIYQPYGIVQTGAGSTARFTISGDRKESLSKALEQVEVALRNAPEAGVIPVGEALELVSDVRSEVSKPNPNWLRVRSGLAGVASTVQTLGSAAGAYQALKAAAAFLNVHLP